MDITKPPNRPIGFDRGRTYRTRYRAAFSTSEKPHPQPLCKGWGAVAQGRRQKAEGRRQKAEGKNADIFT
ncbi:hypothetical protein Osc7112_1100 [Oscillatoria nigro-viridis PCC 7112]|uniref:Uncharacterized protein n=1 Tax=Phormidium nigroviride PCC 7112 TaxID=179408 RepID=K9VEI5_9CYAN|nr:hypothetical protein Osc7112_1100 [Oscillatoria nigro-viridis PCC 7112]